MVRKLKGESIEAHRKRERLAKAEQRRLRKQKEYKREHESERRRRKKEQMNNNLSPSETPILSHPATPGRDKAFSGSRAPPGTAYKDMSRDELDNHAVDCHVDLIESSKRDSEILQANAMALTADLKEQSRIRYESHQEMMEMIKQQQRNLDQKEETPKGRVLFDPQTCTSNIPSPAADDAGFFSAQQENVPENVPKEVLVKTPSKKKKPAMKTPATKTQAKKKAPATKTLATKKAPATKAPATKTPATKTPATKTPATKTPATKTPAKKMVTAPEEQEQPPAKKKLTKKEQLQQARERARQTKFSDSICKSEAGKTPPRRSTRSSVLKNR